MAKKKGKRYQPPAEKFVVVVHPWGNPAHRMFLLNVAGWFEVMLRDDYPNTRVNAIYRQGKRNNLIVELPEHVDINTILGSHPYAKIINPPLNTSKQIAYIYEYNYIFHDHPTKRNWVAEFPDYEQLPSDFPVRSPYPHPEKAPPPPAEIDYAIRLPAEMQLHTATPVASTSSLALDPPQATPSDDPLQRGMSVKEEAEVQRLLVDKRDPYQEEDAASRLLHNVLPVKKEEPKTEDGTPIIPIKHEGDERKPNVRVHDNYTPSADLAAAISGLPSGVASRSESRSSEVDEKKFDIRVHDNYTPSAEVSAALAGLPRSILNASPSVSARPSTGGIIKQESINSHGTYQPSAELLSGFAMLPPSLQNHAHPKSSVKREGVHNSRDRRGISTSGIKHTRDGGEEEDGGPAKRPKRES